MEQKTYDVFISYSRKDYVLDGKIISGNPISAIIELFDKNGISYWIDKNGIFVGEEFVKEISKAIANSKMLVFVSSKNSNESEYTCGEILKAKKEKKQIIPFRIDKCDYNEKFEILLLPLQHVDYFEQPDTALSVLLSEVNREKKRIERIEADAEKQQIVEAVRKEIKEKAKEYHALVGQQDDILKDLYAKNKIIGNIKKQCPVCEKEVQIQSSFCDKCGWQFPSLYSLDGRKTPICDETQLTLARAHWHGLNSIIQLQNENQKLKKELRKEEETISEETNFTIRLSKAAKEFNVGKDTVVEFLAKKGFQVDPSPNTKLTEEMYALLVKEYQDEKEMKEAMRLAEEKSKAKEKRRQVEITPKERVFTVGETSFKMIRVEGGKMGTFYIGETQVTQALWQAVMGNNPSQIVGLDHPVEFVSWNDCQSFVKMLNEELKKDMNGNLFRLPKEAEWKYAAQGGNRSRGYIYAGSNNIDEVAWYWKNSGNSYLDGGDEDWNYGEIEENNCRTHPVKTKSSNELGIYDMSGNVCEWCGNLSGSSDSARVLRGGGWDDRARCCRVSFRASIDPKYKSNGVGFRLVFSQ